MYDRVLTLSIEDFDRITERYKWRFYEIIEDGARIRVEVPKGDQEVLVVYYPYDSQTEEELQRRGFILQEVKNWRDY